MGGAAISAVLLIAVLALAACGGGATEAQQQLDGALNEYQTALEKVDQIDLQNGFVDLNLPEFEGARLTLRYCVQCHNLANPAMHHAPKWPSIVRRMVLRMQGRGNMGTLMSEMMAGVKAPTAEETRTIVAYLQKHAQSPLDPGRYPEVFTPAGEAFRLACNQCHVLPDPKRHTAEEWPGVVARMQENMQWMNRVVGTKPIAGEPQLRIDEILAFLRRHARP